MKKIDFNCKSMIINLAGTCFWFWNTFYSFLENCEIPASTYKQFGKDGGKYQVMRSVLELLEKQQRYDLIKKIATQFYNLHLLEDGIDRSKAEKLLKNFREMTKSTLLEDEINQKEKNQKIADRKKISEEKQSYITKLSKLKDEFLCLNQTNDKIQRGYAIEKLFFDLLELEEFQYKRPYKIIGEQIDGHFRYEKFDYLVEIKWEEKISSQSDLSIFDGKIKGKAQSTRGLFFSINGFGENAISKFSGDSPRIILMDGQDFFHVLDERTTLFDLLKLKVDGLVRKGDIFVKY